MLGGLLSDEYFNSIWKNSLESFLVGHIVYHSQIDDFNSSDLIAITKLSSILLVFDGFDEIADTKIREDVIDFINKGVNRIIENSKSIQIIITSRPAAFSDTIGFAVDIYPHFELTDITPAITKEYVEKWIRASKLDTREGNEIKRLVEEKLKLPHLKELAKSPMQLAIFISLLRTRGESLPNKRTALYDSYIELFFNRESEKNVTIRDHRDLIIDIHQYLAWTLHSEAELHNNTGIIGIEDLKLRLKAYLTKEGHETDIADKLFHVMEERVCALVSRVQGTYEFEVQPLREYFCAKYLYNTSPYSPAGLEKTGTKPERFDAIARNFYWHNVVRFFAGCFDKGELPMLIQKLKELQEDDILRNTNYPRLLTSQILSDWVFTQYPILLKDVVKIIIDGINIGNIINQEGRIGHNEPILLPNSCGRQELISECFNQLRKFPHNDYASELIGIIKNNPFQTVEFWTNHLENFHGEKLSKWLEYAYLLEIVHKIEERTLIKIIEEGNQEQRESRLQTLIDGNRLEIFNSNPVLKNIVFNGVLEGKISVHHRTYSESSLQFLTVITHPYLLGNILMGDESSIPFINSISQRIRYYPFDKNPQKSITEFIENDENDKLIKRFVSLISKVLLEEISVWKTSIEPWNLLVESYRSIFNDSLAIKVVSVIAAGIRSKDENYEYFSELTDQTKPLCKRVRCARLKSGNTKYWSSQLENSTDISFTLLVLFTWATPKTINQLSETISTILNKITDIEFSTLNFCLRRTSRYSHFSPFQSKNMSSDLMKNNVSTELCYFISYRYSEEYRNKFVYDNIFGLSSKMANVSSIKLSYLLEKYFADPKNISLLEEVKTTYSMVSNLEEKKYYNYNYHRYETVELPISIANCIMSESKLYPRIVSSFAEKACRQFANKSVTAVGQVAKNDKWFE